MKVCVIFNPVARGDKARHLCARLSELAREAVLKPTQSPGDARRLGAEAVQEGFETIVAAGGDGTLNEVLNGIADAKGFQRVRLAVLPLGTVNVFAKELKLPQDFAGAWSTIQRGKEMLIDAPWAEHVVQGQAERRFFAQMAGAGLDSRAVGLVSWELKKRLGSVSYMVAGLRAFAGKLPQIEVDLDGATVSGQMVLVGNGKLYGGRFTMFPRADLCDGVLEAVVYPRVNIGAVARGCWAMMTDDFHTGSGTVQLRGAKLNLHCSEQTPLQLDGENVGQLPANFGLEPRTLRVIVP